MPKVPAQTLGWIAAAYTDEKSDKSSVAATHKSLVPAIVKCADHKEPDVRAAAIDALAAHHRASTTCSRLAEPCPTASSAAAAVDAVVSVPGICCGTWAGSSATSARLVWSSAPRVASS